MPEPIKPPPAPEDVKTVEELYLHGLRLDQFHNASVSSYPYYQEALRRDPGDYRVNTQLGILFTKRKMFDEAEKHLQKAVDRITMRYTRPKDSDALYYLGVVKRRLNKNDEAYDLFYDASWNSGWHTAAFHQLAELDCQNGNFDKALEHVNRAISTNDYNVKAAGLKITILRKLGRLDEAEDLAIRLIERDNLLYHPRNELFLISQELKRNRQANKISSELENIMQDRVQSYLEFATEYYNCGLYKEAIDILTRLENKGEQFPMLYYHLGYYWSLYGDRDMAQQYFSVAPLKPHDYCFPFRDESLAALNLAIKYNKDAMAYYYLGNMFYELQPEKAIELWQTSLDLDDSFYITQRNLAWAAQEQNDVVKAVEYYSSAFSRNNEDTRLMYEFDLAYERAAVSPEIRFTTIYEGNRHISERQSSTFMRELELLVFLGRFDEVIDIVVSKELIEAEGSQVLRDIFLNAHILRSVQQASLNKIDLAIKDMQSALDFPIGRWGSERRAEMYYLLGTYNEKAGNFEAAKNYFELTVNENVEGTEYHYYKGLVYRKLGNIEKSRAEFNTLLELSGRRSGADAFRSFEAGSAAAARQAQNHYIRGLAYKGLGRDNDARLQFNSALELNPAHLWASCQLDVI
jgi:tetratricopeptide (TPR) repeat protein